MLPALRVALSSVEGARPLESRRAIQLLECFLQVTRQSLRLDDIRDSRSKLVTQTYLGALHSEKFSDRSLQAAYRTGRATLIAFAHMGSPWQPLDLLDDLSVVRVSPNVVRWREEFDAMKLDGDAVYYWSGWPCVSAAGRTHFLQLHALYRKHGRGITDCFHQAAVAYLASRRAHNVPCANEFARYLEECDGEVLKKLRDCRYASRDFLKHFACEYVEKKYAKGKGSSVSSIVTLWNAHFLTFVNDYLVPHGLLAPPAGAPLQLPPNRTPASRRSIRKRGAGLEFKSNLLTEVPLHVTDAEAKELLFRQIRTDFDHIIEWAKAESEQLWARYLRRKRIAPNGKVRVILDRFVSGDLKWRTSRANPEWLANAAATYEFYGVRPDVKGRASVLYPPPLDGTAEDLGLPIPGRFLPHATLLVADHPQLTPALLEGLELFDQQGKKTGFVELDGASYLVGLKHRRGKYLAEMRIPLTPLGAELVRQIILLTDSYRKYLRESGDDSWRRLFLSARLGGRPRPIRFAWYTAGPHQRRIAREIESRSGVTAAKATALTRQFNLRAVRATRAVLIYLETQSVQAVADALGHKEHSANLLDSYLPRPILDFFQERWIRIFQEGLLVEALKDSPMLMEACSFRTMAELDAFLTNHALRDLPGKLEESRLLGESKGAEASASEVLIGVNVSILTALVSLSEAVERIGPRVSGTAIYWSEFSRQVTAFIESYWHRPDLQEMLKTARRQSDWQSMADLVNVAT